MILFCNSCSTATTDHSSSLVSLTYTCEKVGVQLSFVCERSERERLSWSHFVCALLCFRFLFYFIAHYQTNIKIIMIMRLMQRLLVLLWYNKYHLGLFLSTRLAFELYDTMMWFDHRPTITIENRQWTNNDINDGTSAVQGAAFLPIVMKPFLLLLLTIIYCTSISHAVKFEWVNTIDSFLNLTKWSCVKEKKVKVETLANNFSFSLSPYNSIQTFFYYSSTFIHMEITY